MEGFLRFLFAFFSAVHLSNADPHFMLSKQPWLSPTQSYRPQDSSHSYDHPNLEVTQAKRSTRANAGFQIEI